MSALLLRLAGPTQAWDSRRRASQYDSRHGSHVGPTGLMPTYSAIIGLLGAALGRPRGAVTAVADRTDPAWAAAVTPLRCYCGHESCWAFASWEPLPPRGALAPTPVTTRRNAWATREESTWIDKL